MARNRIPEIREVLANLDKDFTCEQETTVATNSITIELAAVEGKRHYIQHVMLYGTTGDGGAEALTISKGSTAAWTEAFTVGTDKDRPFYGFGFVGDVGEAVSIVASATALTAGTLSVVSYVK